MRAALEPLDSTAKRAPQTVDAMVLPLHAEHYGKPMPRAGIETMTSGPVPVEARRISSECIDISYLIRLTGAGQLVDDISHTTFVLQQVEDTEGVIGANLRMWCPAPCPPSMSKSISSSAQSSPHDGRHLAVSATRVRIRRRGDTLPIADDESAWSPRQQGKGQ